MGARHLFVRGAPLVLLTTLSIVAAPASASAPAPEPTAGGTPHGSTVEPQPPHPPETTSRPAKSPPPTAHAEPREPASPEVVRPTTGRLTSQFGMRGGSRHNGVDIANSIGTPVLSAMDGTVVDSGAAGGFGLWVRVRHDQGITTVYGHIDESLVSVGQRVSAGEQIATLGNRGQSTGPHLHFEVHQKGRKTDPLRWLTNHAVSL